jgi:hypothetical protein
VDFGEALTCFDECAEYICVRGGLGCLRASLSGNGLRQSGVVFFFVILDAGLEGPLFHGGSSDHGGLANSAARKFRGRAGLQPCVWREIIEGF